MYINIGFILPFPYRYPCDFQDFATSGNKLDATFAGNNWALVKKCAARQPNARTSTGPGTVDWIPQVCEVTYPVLDTVSL